MSADYNTHVQIHPSALATMVDAHERRGRGADEKNKSYVIGTLMGTTDGNITYIDQVFVVNYQRCLDDRHGVVFQIDKQHQQEMLALTQAATPDQGVVGWFNTANETDFTELDKLMYDYYSGEGQKPQRHSDQGEVLYLQHKKQTYNRPLFLRCNIAILREKDDIKKGIIHRELPVKAFLPEVFNVVKEDNHHMSYDLMWTELPVIVGCGSAERTALDMINKTAETNPETNKPYMQLDAVSSNLDPLANLAGSMLTQIDTVKDFIDDALANDGQLDESTGRLLAEIFNGVPGLDQEQLEKMLNGELTDLLMVTYLSQLANVQLTLNDKLKNAFAQTPLSAEKKIMSKGKRTNMN